MKCSVVQSVLSNITDPSCSEHEIRCFPPSSCVGYWNLVRIVQKLVFEKMFDKGFVEPEYFVEDF